MTSLKFKLQTIDPTEILLLNDVLEKLKTKFPTQHFQDAESAVCRFPLDAALLVLANNKDDFYNTGPGRAKREQELKVAAFPTLLMTIVGFK